MQPEQREQPQQGEESEEGSGERRQRKKKERAQDLAEVRPCWAGCAWWTAAVGYRGTRACGHALGLSGCVRLIMTPLARSSEAPPATSPSWITQQLFGITQDSNQCYHALLLLQEEHERRKDAEHDADRAADEADRQRRK